MSRRATDKRKSRVLTSLFGDPWRKLISIGLGILLWFYLNNQITTTYDPNAALHFKDSSRDSHITVVVGSTSYGLKRFKHPHTGTDLAEVRLEFSGPRRQIKQLEKQVEFLVEFTDKDVKRAEGAPFVVFRREHLHHKSNRAFDELLTGMDPSTVVVELEPNEKKSLLLSAANVEVDVDEALRKRLGPPKFTPPSVEVFGPAAEIQNIASDSRLFTARIPSTTGNSVSVQLELIDAFRKRGITARAPLVSYDVEPERVRFKLEKVPVVLDKRFVEDQDTAAQFEASPAEMDVTIEVSKTSDLYSRELHQYVQVEGKLHTVPSLWTRQHARILVYLRPDDITKESITPRQARVELFEVDAFDRKIIYQRGRDYEDPDQSGRQIDIKRKGKKQGND